MNNSKKIEQILKKSDGGLLAGEIIRELINKLNMSKEAARKALQRVSSPIKKVDDINFNHNQSFFYLKNIDYKVKKKLHKYCNQENKPEAMILNALISRGGFCAYKYLPIISGIPVKKVSNNKLFIDAFNSLKNLEMIQDHNDSESQERICFLYQKENRSYSESKFYFSLEDEILKQLKRMFVNLNFSSKDAIKIRIDKELPLYGSCNWSLVGPCYLDGIRIGQKNGFICCDIFLNEKINSNNIKPILKKYDLTKAQNRNVRFIPALFFQSISKPLLKELRQKGFMTISAKTFQGDELLMFLEEIRSLWVNKNKNNPETIKTILKGLSRKWGNDDNIRGFFFNLIVKSIFEIEYENVKMSKIVQHESYKKEVDVFFEDKKFRYIIETKAWSNFSNKDKEIEIWVNEKLEFFKRWNISKEDSKELIIYFITPLCNKEAIENINRNLPKPVVFYGYNFLYGKLKNNNKELRDALKLFKFK